VPPSTITDGNGPPAWSRSTRRRLERAQPIAPGSSVAATALLARRQDLLDQDMRRRIGTVEAVLADRELAYRGAGLKLSSTLRAKSAP